MLERGTTLSFKRLFGMHWTWLISWRWQVGFVFVCLREHGYHHCYYRNHWKWALNVITLFVRLQWTHWSPGCAADRTFRYSHGTLSKKTRSVVCPLHISWSNEVPSEERISKHLKRSPCWWQKVSVTKNDHYPARPCRQKGSFGPVETNKLLQACGAGQVWCWQQVQMSQKRTGQLLWPRSLLFGSSTLILMAL